MEAMGQVLTLMARDPSPQALPTGHEVALQLVRPGPVELSPAHMHSPSHPGAQGKLVRNPLTLPLRGRAGWEEGTLLLSCGEQRQGQPFPGSLGHICTSTSCRLGEGYPHFVTNE